MNWMTHYIGSVIWTYIFYGTCEGLCVPLRFFETRWANAASFGHINHEWGMISGLTRGELTGIEHVAWWRLNICTESRFWNWLKSDHPEMDIIETLNYVTVRIQNNQTLPPPETSLLAHLYRLRPKNRLILSAAPFPCNDPCLFPAFPRYFCIRLCHR